MKILFLDIETTAHVVNVYSLWNQNIGLANLLEASRILCWSAKWYKDDKIYFSKVNPRNPQASLRLLHKLLDQADAVVHYNGKKFDIPIINKEFILCGFQPPSPYKQIDVYNTVRSKFKFASGKLEYVAEALGCGKKRSPGVSVWRGCVDGDAESWRKMQTYNENDTLILEKVYTKLLPWISGHANYSAFKSGLVCPNCGGTHLQSRGWYVSKSLRYRRVQCQDCGTWARVGKAESRDLQTRVSSIKD